MATIRGRELRCSGSMGRRLRFSAPAVTVSLGRRTSNRASHSMLPSNSGSLRRLWGCDSGQAQRARNRLPLRLLRWPRPSVASRGRLAPTPPASRGRGRRKKRYARLATPSRWIAAVNLTSDAFPVGRARLDVSSGGKSRATRFGYRRPKPSFVQPHSSGRCGPNGRDRPAPRSYAA
jgi:hypothetical protein